MNIIQDLNWRYATKRMNNETIAKDKFSIILEAIRLAPTSMGLQPFNVIIIEDKAIKEKMKVCCYNQPQITESAYMLVFAVWNGGYEEKTEEFIKLISTTRKQTLESLAAYKNRLLSFLENADKIEWASRQAYIALGVAISTCSLLKVDSTPMEGFDRTEIDKVLDLEKYGLKSVVIMAIGNRDETNDYLMNLPKVRRADEDFFIKL